jgi:hypothetical protein
MVVAVSQSASSSSSPWTVSTCSSGHSACKRARAVGTRRTSAVETAPTRS